jgi:cell division protein FtsQ
MTVSTFLDRLGRSWPLRVTARSFAILFLTATIIHGTVRNAALAGNETEASHMPGRLASLIGLAADDIKVSGLVHHDSQALLNAIGIVPGSSLIAFDANAARHKLEAMGWVEGASVQRKFPNMLEIVVKEREAFAIWQHKGVYVLIDRNGTVMGGLDQMFNGHLPLVTGEGANLAAGELVNQLSATPELLSKVSAAARLGSRRWNLYLDNGVKVELPEQGVPEALRQVADLDKSQNILSKGISQLDLRIAGQMTVAVAEVEKDAGAPADKASQPQ